ncbi:hypothetical protein PRIPAC_83479, partial [Pristionchus pacificus]
SVISRMHNEKDQNGSGWSLNTFPPDLSQFLDASASSQNLFSIVTPERSVNSLASSSTALSSSLPTQFSLSQISYNQLLRDLTAKHEQQGSSASSAVTAPCNPIFIPNEFSQQSLLQNAMNGLSSQAPLSISSIPFDTQSVHSAVSRAKKRSITEMRRTSLPPHSIADDVSAHFQTIQPSTSQSVQSPFIDQPTTSKEDKAIQKELALVIREVAKEELRRRPAPILVDTYPRAPTPENYGTLSENFPTHFFKGTKILLPSGEKKYVEDLVTADFILCAKLSTDMMMITASIHLIEKNKSSHRITVITSNNDKMSMECGPEQPFFVIGQGWKSAAPDKTRENFGLNATLLEQGDVCIILTSCEYTSMESRALLDSIVTPRESALDEARELKKFNEYQNAVKKLPKKSKKKRNADRRRRRERRLSEPPRETQSSKRGGKKRSQSVDPHWETSLPPKPSKPFSPKNIQDYPIQIGFDFEI